MGLDVKLKFNACDHLINSMLLKEIMSSTYAGV